MIQDRLARADGIENVVLMALVVNERLKGMGAGVHLSENKGPVMDRLQATHVLDHLNGRVFLSQYDAWVTLSDRPAAPEAAE